MPHEQLFGRFPAIPCRQAPVLRPARSDRVMFTGPPDAGGDLRRNLRVEKINPAKRRRVRLEHLGRETSPTDNAPIPMAPGRAKQSRAALDQPTLHRRPVSEPIRFRPPWPFTALTKRGLFPRGLP